MSDTTSAPAAEEAPDFPITCATFVDSLKGKPDEVYGRLITLEHGRKKMRAAQWPAVIEAYRRMPAHPAHRA